METIVTYNPLSSSSMQFLSVPSDNTVVPLTNNANTEIYDATGTANGRGGCIQGTITIDASTDYIAQFDFQWRRKYDGTFDGDVEYRVGSLPFFASMSISSDGKISVTLPNLSGFVEACAIFAPRAEGNAGARGTAWQETFETVSKNIAAKPALLNYTGGALTSIVYDLGNGKSITKALDYTDGALTSITLSGDTPNNIDLIKNLVYDVDGNLVEFTYGGSAFMPLGFFAKVGAFFRGLF